MRKARERAERRRGRKAREKQGRCRRGGEQEETRRARRAREEDKQESGTGGPGWADRRTEQRGEGSAQYNRARDDKA